MDDISPHISTVASHYQYPETPSVVTKIQDMLSEVQRWISDVLDLLNISFPGMSDNRASAAVLEVIISLLAAVATVAIIYFAWQRLGKLKQQSRLARSGATATAAILDARAWRLRSEEFAAQNNWRQSCRALYMSFLNLLDENEVATFVPTKTNYEYIYDLKGRQDIESLFADMVGCVESVWFGNRPACREDYKLCLSSLDRLETILKNRTGNSAGNTA